MVDDQQGVPAAGEQDALPKEEMLVQNQQQQKQESGKTILLVEDDKFLRDLLAARLEQEGFKVLLAIDGKEGLDAAKKELPGLILLDLILPEMDGFEVLEKLKQDNTVSSIPVLVLSNLGQREEIDRAMKLGAVDFMVKAHFTPGEIVQRIKSLL